MVNSKCVACLKNSKTEIFSGDDWQAIECTNCGLVFINSKKSETYDNYHRDNQYNLSRVIFRNIFLNRFNLIKKYIKSNGKVLDVGCSNGIFLDLFKENGWETYGIEPSINYLVSKNKGHEIYNDYFEKVKLKTDFFDLIIMNHTLEHVKNPNLFIKLSHKYLKKGGILYIDVPNFKSLLSGLTKSKWPYLLPYEHIYQFSETPLKKIVERNGFEVKEVKSRSGIFEYKSLIFELLFSLINMPKRFLKTIINIPYDLIATFLNKGDSISILCIKK